ncbi:hypothetical protein JW926_17330 [Candidatus Sumerlaeota bacterium]|nr:hypothetical protein [Candidatus Sumerlaeota bacterium]
MKKREMRLETGSDWGTKRGSILVVSFFLCLLMGIAALWASRTLLDHQKTNLRRRDINRAHYAASGGVAQVLHWGNFPAEYDDLGTESLFYRDPDTGEFPNLSAVMAGGSEVVLSSDKYGKFISKYNYDVSDIKKITLIPPDPDNDPVPCLFKVQSEGNTPSGSHRNILAYIQPNPVETIIIKIPAGLISMGNAALVGNPVIRWGETWAKSDLNMMEKSHASHLDNTSPDHDPWAKYRTEGNIIFPPTWKSGEGKDIYQEDSRMYPGAVPASGNYADAFQQFIPDGVLEWPDFSSLYDVLKQFAISHGRYYSTDASGNIYKEGIEDTAHKVDFTGEFEITDRSNAPYDLVFIDTIDGNPPAADGSNLATIKSSGVSTGLKGIFWIGANFEQTGSGVPPLLTGAEKPDGSTIDLSGIYLDGVLYSAGNLNLGGNAGIYGSVIAQGGFSANGTPHIYYNHKIMDGFELDKGNVGSVFKIALQKNY